MYDSVMGAPAATCFIWKIRPRGEIHLHVQFAIGGTGVQA